MIDVQLTHQLSPAQVDQLLSFYDDVWWAKGRTREGVEKMLRGCLPFAFIQASGDTTGRLVAFARVVGDGIYKATIFDVIVAPDQRGTGLGQYVMDAVMEHPQVASVRHVELQCKPELDEFYRRWHFAPVEGILYMRRTAT
jgi:ribosomal protein S18 acetylase RimI-like enzyme